MTEDRFTELLNGPLNYLRTAFFMLRLANALRSAVQRCSKRETRRSKPIVRNWTSCTTCGMNRSRMKRRGERYTKVCGGAGVNQYDSYTSRE